jgi:phosphatidylglycerol---prolipoprotein diacylglyceryl transferase
MFPVILELGPLKIHSYGLMIAAGFLVALYFVRREARKAGYDPDIFTNAAYWCLFLGILGTRVLYIIMFPDQFSWTRPLQWFAIWEGGLVFQGGAPPAVAFCYFYLRAKGVNFWKAADVALPYVALGHGVGRLGCFFNGCCYGERCDLPWAVRFPAGSPPYHDHIQNYGLPLDATASFLVHPTQLYGALGLVLLAVVLLQIRKYWRGFDGVLAPAYLVLYGVGRFVVEMLRGDRNPMHWGPITDQQLFSLLSIVAGVILFLILLSMHSKRSAHPIAHNGR